MKLKSSSPFKLALIGKDISHSRSPHYYQKYFDNLLSYDLIDIPNENELPKLSELAKNYIAINITSPFKRAYLSQIEMKDVPHDLKAINLIGLNGETFVGTNTDYLALNSLLLNYRGKNKEAVILGDGVMSQVTCRVLKDQQMPFKIFSRKKSSNFLQYDFSLQFKSETLFINTCARSLDFQGRFPENSVVFDMNYGETIFHKFCKNQKLELIDGTELFNLQAQHTVSFIRKFCLVD